MYAEAKRREAVFFLEKIQQHHHADDQFSFYLSALVSAFRSVTLAIQYEHSENPVAKALYEEGLVRELAQDPFAVGLRDARNDQIHQGHTWPRVVHSIKNPKTGHWALFEGAPLPNGFDRFRGTTVYTPPELCLPLTGGQEEMETKAMQQALLGIIALRSPECQHEVLVKLTEKAEPIAIGEFFRRVGDWLERFRSAIEQIERNVPVSQMHHVQGEAEAVAVLKITNAITPAPGATE